MIVAFTFKAKPGKEEEMREHLDNPQGGLNVVRRMGARRNLLTWHGDRMVRIIEFDEGVQPVPLSEVAKQDEKVHAFLKRLGQLTEPGFDPDDEQEMDAVSSAASMQVLYDVQVDS